mmetsp:Transcript_68878/g.201681  ORF Transcript_68878/g.201681 Transcript_68878/m.201681 type:complete len:325 (+) Transcript_68878:229-1203(+)
MHVPVCRTHRRPLHHLWIGGHDLVALLGGVVHVVVGGVVVHSGLGCELGLPGLLRHAPALQELHDGDSLLLRLTLDVHLCEGGALLDHVVVVGLVLLRGGEELSHAVDNVANAMPSIILLAVRLIIRVHLQWPLRLGIRVILEHYVSGGGLLGTIAAFRVVVYTLLVLTDASLGATPLSLIAIAGHPPAPTRPTHAHKDEKHQQGQQQEAKEPDSPRVLLGKHRESVPSKLQECGLGVFGQPGRVVGLALLLQVHAVIEGDLAVLALNVADAARDVVVVALTVGFLHFPAHVEEAIAPLLRLALELVRESGHAAEEALERLAKR